MRWIGTTAVLLVAATAVAAPVGARAGESTAAWCEQQWKQISGSTTSSGARDPGILLEQWRALEGRCKGTVAYEARLAAALDLADRQDEARAVLATVQGVSSDYGYLTDLVVLVMDVRELGRRQPDQAAIKKVEAQARGFVTRHPDLPEGHGLLGGVLVMSAKHGEAVPELQRALASEMDTSGVLRNLAVCLAALGRYQEAFRAGDQAYRKDPELSSDPEFMYAIARSSAAIGNLKTAKNALVIIAAKRPRVSEDPEFQAARAFVDQQSSGKATVPKP